MRRASRATRVAVATFLAICAGQTRQAAWAAEAPELVVTEGASIDPSRLRTHLSIELVGDDLPTRIEVSRAALGASAGAKARGPARVRLVFADGSTEERELGLADVTEGDVPRVLALAIAEASRAHVGAPRPAAPPAPTASLARPVPPRPALTAPTPPRPSFRFGAEGAIGARGYGTAGTLAVEPRLGVFVRHTTGARAELAFAYAAASASDPLGSVSARAFLGSLGASYERDLTSRLALSLGPRLDIGAAVGSGEATGGARASSASGAMVGVVGEIVGRLRLSASLRALIAVDAGGVMRGLSFGADQRVPIALGGATFAARLGLAFE